MEIVNVFIRNIKNIGLVKKKINYIFWCYVVIFVVFCVCIILKFLWWVRKNNYDFFDEIVF